MSYSSYSITPRMTKSTFQFLSGKRAERRIPARVCVCVQSQLLRCLMGSCPERAVCDSPVDTVCLTGLLGCGY